MNNEQWIVDSGIRPTSKEKRKKEILNFFLIFLILFKIHLRLESRKPDGVYEKQSRSAKALLDCLIL